MSRYSFSLGIFLFFAVNLVSSQQVLGQYGTVTIDGQLNEWDEFDRLDLYPWQGSSGDALYNTFADTNYLFAIRSGLISSGTSSTIWINTDRNSSTGFKIFGFAGGVENKIDISVGATTTATLYRYVDFNAGTTQVVASLPVAAVNGSLEVAVPRSLLVGTPASVNLLYSLQGGVRSLPSDFSQFQYLASGAARPVRTDFSKRIGIIYSQTTAQRYFDLKAYSQLLMSVQHQAMMAGLPFDLISEDQLLDIHNLVNFDTLVFPLFSHVKAAQRDVLEHVLTDAAYRYRIGLLASGDFITNSETGAVLSGDPYRTMKNVLGLASGGGGGPVALTIIPGQVSHPTTRMCSSSDVLVSYPSVYYRYFTPVAGFTSTVIAKSKVGSTENRAVQIVTYNGSKRIHFATDQFLGDTKLGWSALQWLSYESAVPVALQMGRNQSIFFARNDMDQSMFADEFNSVNIPLENLVKAWKQSYNFAGSFYINIGNNPGAGEFTDWNVSRPYYQRLMSIQNEIGDHSYTHPHDTNALSNAQIAFEFNSSKSVIEQQMSLSGIGCAIPGNPDTLATALKIESAARFPYISGGYSGFGAGFPGAFGYLNPTSGMIYFSPNMTPDFTMIEFQRKTAAQAEAQWQSEFTANTKFGSQPIVHLMWHDYGPTSSLSSGYSVRMYDELFKRAYNDGSEFVTGKDLSQRVASLANASLKVTNPAASTVSVTGTNMGTFSLYIDKRANGSKVIRNVGNWYAFNDERVFLPEAGGSFVPAYGTGADNITHIISLPMRARLRAVSGNGQNLNFSFTGSGFVQVKVKSVSGLSYNVVGANTVSQSGDLLTLGFTAHATHSVSVTGSTAPTPTPTVTPTRTSTPTPVLSAVFYSIGADDGWILESGRTTSIGGTLSASGTGGNALRIGDNTANREFRSVLSFNTSALPDTATITSVVVQLKRGGLRGQPFSKFGPAVFEIRNGNYSGNAALESKDFQAASSVSTAVGQFSSVGAAKTIQSIPLLSTAYELINLTGKTQLKLRFSKNADTNSVSDYVGFYPGNSSATADRPKMIVYYTN